MFSDRWRHLVGGGRGACNSLPTILLSSLFLCLSLAMPLEPFCLSSLNGSVAALGARAAASISRGARNARAAPYGAAGLHRAGACRVSSPFYIACVAIKRISIITIANSTLGDITGRGKEGGRRGERENAATPLPHSRYLPLSPRLRYAA